MKKVSEMRYLLAANRLRSWLAVNHAFAQQRRDNIADRARATGVAHRSIRIRCLAQILRRVHVPRTDSDASAGQDEAPLLDRRAARARVLADTSYYHARSERSGANCRSIDAQHDASDMPWTTSLGNAFLTRQPQDMRRGLQRLRQRARATTATFASNGAGHGERQAGDRRFCRRRRATSWCRMHPIVIVFATAASSSYRPLVAIRYGYSGGTDRRDSSGHGAGAATASCGPATA